MADTLETVEIPAPAEAASPPPVVVLPPHLAARGRRFKSLFASAAEATAERRLFVVLPFAVIAGLVVSVDLPVEPDPVALGVGAGVLALGLLFATRSLTAFRLATLAAAFWS